MTDSALDSDTGIAISSFYFNGFQMNLSNADVSALLMLNNQPLLSLNMSYTTAKTLADALHEVVAALEKVTGHDIMTTKQVGQALEKLNADLESINRGQPN